MSKLKDNTHDKYFRFQNKLENNVKLNISKFPKDFFPNPKPRRFISKTQRIQGNDFNQFMDCHRTVELRDIKTVDNCEDSLKKIRTTLNIKDQKQTSKPKRQYTSQQRKRVSIRHNTIQPREEHLKNDEIFLCTFSKKMYTEQIPNPAAAKRAMKSLPKQYSNIKEEIQNNAISSKKKRSQNVFTAERLNAIKNRSKHENLQKILQKKMMAEMEYEFEEQSERNKFRFNLPFIESARKAA